MHLKVEWLIVNSMNDEKFEISRKNASFDESLKKKTKLKSKKKINFTSHRSFPFIHWIYDCRSDLKSTKFYLSRMKLYELLAGTQNK